MRRRVFGDDSVIWQAARCVLSRCSSTDVSLWSGKNGEPRHSHQDDGCWECDKQAFVCDHGGGADTSFMGFSGLYILCWVGSI